MELKANEKWTSHIKEYNEILKKKGRVAAFEFKAWVLEWANYKLPVEETNDTKNLEEKMTQIFQEEGDFALGEEISKWGTGTLRGILMNSPDLSGEEVREVPDEDLIDCVSRMWIH